MAETNWYALRAAPGSQRMARVIEASNDQEETEEQKVKRERRKGESIIERNLRNEGIDVYMPSFWAIRQHQRTNRMSERRFPLMVGYVFVNIAERDFEKVRRVEGVMCFMRPSPERGPIAFRDTDIGRLMFDDFQAQQEWERDREARLLEGQKHRRNALNKRLGLIFPKGRRQKVPLRMVAEAAIENMPTASRNHVRAILAELNAMDKEMEACRSSSIRLYSAA